MNVCVFVSVCARRARGERVRELDGLTARTIF